jgi:hypothetical protein
MYMYAHFFTFSGKSSFDEMEKKFQIEYKTRSSELESLRMLTEDLGTVPSHERITQCLICRIGKWNEEKWIVPNDPQLWNVRYG